MHIGSWTRSAQAASLGAAFPFELAEGFTRLRAFDNSEGDYICRCDAKDASDEIGAIEGVVDVSEQARTRTEL